MSINKFKYLEANEKIKLLYGLLLKEGEKRKLYEICIKYKININYPDLFNDDTHYYLWGISNKGIGLIGTIIMNYLKENNGIIFNSLDELEQYLKERNKDE